MSTIYTAINQPNSIYFHGDSNNEEIEIFDNNLCRILAETDKFHHIKDVNKNTDSEAEIWATDENIIITNGMQVQVEKIKDDDEIVDISNFILDEIIYEKDLYVDLDDETVRKCAELINNYCK